MYLNASSLVSSSLPNLSNCARSAGQVVGQFSIQWISDWFGRKMAMYGFLFLLLIVSRPHATEFKF